MITDTSLTTIFDFVCGLGPRNTHVATTSASVRLHHLIRELGLKAHSEFFETWDQMYDNIVIGAPVGTAPVLTAHYDTCGNTVGACDNSSGVTVALATALEAQSLGRPLTVVLTACEEPPFFAHKMGAEEFTRRHLAVLRDTPVYAIDSIGWRDPRIATKHLSLFAPCTGTPWARPLALRLNEFLDVRIDEEDAPVRQLSEVRQTYVPAVLILDNCTLSVPFHTTRDVPAKVDLEWLQLVTDALAATL